MRRCPRRCAVGRPARRLRLALGLAGTLAALAGTRRLLGEAPLEVRRQGRQGRGRRASEASEVAEGPALGLLEDLADEAFGGNKTEEEHVNCVHGAWDPHGKHCVCNEGWRAAGITDTFDFIGGLCTQFMCQTDAQCQSELGLSHATCPVPGWNCYCGFHATGNFFGPGFQTRAHGGAACMGVLYSFSVASTYAIEHFMHLAWKVVLALAALLLPFGRKRTVCIHHMPSLWNTFRKLLYCQSTCRGNCLNPDGYGLMMLGDDLAWSLYAIDLGVWLYLFCFALYFVCMLAWSIILWLVVLFTLLAACCLLCIGGLGELGSIGSCEGCCEACGSICTCDCCAYGAAGSDMGIGLAGPDIFYVDPVYVGSTESCDCCCSSKFWQCLFCKPFALLFFVFPAMPENLHGGIVGLFMGTHALSPNSWMYTGGNSCIDCMQMLWARRGSSNLHDDDSWRVRVRSYLDSESKRPMRVAGTSSRKPTHMQYRGRRCELKYVGKVKVVITERHFRPETDHCQANTYEDYMDQLCWLCQSDDEQWDLWQTCKHMFCHKCSEEMMKRNMPCPLCRQASCVVVRGVRGAFSQPLDPLDGGASDRE